MIGKIKLYSIIFFLFIFVLINKDRSIFQDVAVVKVDAWLDNAREKIHVAKSIDELSGFSISLDVKLPSLPEQRLVLDSSTFKEELPLPSIQERWLRIFRLIKEAKLKIASEHNSTNGIDLVLKTPDDSRKFFVDHFEVSKNIPVQMIYKLLELYSDNKKLKSEIPQDKANL